MKKSYALVIATAMSLIRIDPALAEPDCSTQKVNGDCVLVFDRLDPVTLPAIQMRSKARIRIMLMRSLPFEAVSLDPQSLQAVAPSDQVQGLANAILPDVKGLVPAAMAAAPRHTADVAVHIVNEDLEKLRTLAGVDTLSMVSGFREDLRGFYAQIDEAVSPPPRPLDEKDVYVRPVNLPSATPVPWFSYPKWRQLMLCELLAAECVMPQAAASSRDLIGEGNHVLILLAPVKNQDEKAFEALVSKTRLDIASISPNDNPAIYARQLQQIEALPLIAAAWLPSVQAIVRDLQTYYVNIRETSPDPLDAPVLLGFIDDPRKISSGAGTTTRFLGRQVTYSINTANQIAVMATAVVTASQKTSMATITVLYADPIFEVTTGALFSNLPSRTFTNTTLVTGNSNNLQVTGNTVITQSIVRPTVLPYAAGNWRIGHDFLLDKHRAAAYLTTAVAFNAYNTTAEYAVGPSFSWRMIMFSPLAHFGHDSHLTQGEMVNQVLCTTVAAQANTCVGTPPAPSTTTYWKAAFAFGIGVRVPTSFGTITGH